jgi:hypothetical protein
VQTPENIERVPAFIGHSPRLPAYRHSAALYLSSRLLLQYFIVVYFRILPITHYARTVRPWLHSRSTFCEQFVTLVSKHSDATRNVILSDEFHFELPVCVNKQSKSGANPNKLHVKPRHSQRGTVWSRILALGVIGPYFSEHENVIVVAVTSARYVHMVNEFLLQGLTPS